NGNILSALTRYNPTANLWTSLAPIPFGTEAPAAAYFNGKIYVADGFGSSGFQIYDITSNSWSAGPIVPGVTDSYGAAAGAFNGNVYIVGGGSSASSTTVSIYNIAGNTWSTGPAAPSPYL